MYEIRTLATINLSSPSSASDGSATNHLYYVISGKGHVTLGGKGQEFIPDCLLALPPGGAASLQPSTMSRVLVIHIPADTSLPPPLPSLTSLPDILGSVRDVDWSGGRELGKSRRFLVRADGFNCSVNLVNASPGVTQGMQYVRHREGGYVISGDITYTWEDGGKEVRVPIRNEFFLCAAFMNSINFN